MPAPAFALHADRFFDSDPAVRRAARAIYEGTVDLPLVCPHGHVDPSLLAEDRAFPEPSALLITPDHYLFRMLFSQGISLESLGVPARDPKTAIERDPRKVWRLFASNYHLFRGTPSRAWLDYELHELFGVRQRLSAESADRIYDQIAERLRSPEFRPRALFDSFNIEVLATTDAATDELGHHRAIRDSGWNGRVVPTFRPDALFRIALPTWRGDLAALERVVGNTISTYAAFRDALVARRAAFRALGATATDHAVEEPLTERLAPDAAEAVFAKAMQGDAVAADQKRFEAHMLMEMAAMSVEDGLVMQLHPGSLRDHNSVVFGTFGADKGADIPLRTEYTRNLRALLDAYGSDPRFRIVLFTLDETTYSRELAPLAGHYPAVRLGPAWWFHDSIEGMTRYRQLTTETAGIYNTAGFNDDTRAFCSIPARHDLSRRVDANWLGGLVARHLVELDEAHAMGRALAYELARDTYNFGPGSSETSAGAKPAAMAGATA
ncbi:MAG TPA: glucuronate isomerase [Gemmatimonadaceae bacterium]|nr:glucuronate isomerase [Gemmatimonadaceae bacterium]